MVEIQEITGAQLDAMESTGKPKGLFYFYSKEGGGYFAIDNRTGNVYVELFGSLEECIAYLQSELEADEIKERYRKWKEWSKMFGGVSFGGKPTCPPPPPEGLNRGVEEKETDVTDENQEVAWIETDEKETVKAGKELVLEIHIRLE